MRNVRTLFKIVVVESLSCDSFAARGRTNAHTAHMQTLLLQKSPKMPSCARSDCIFI